MDWFCRFCIDFSFWQMHSSDYIAIYIHAKLLTPLLYTVIILKAALMKREKEGQSVSERAGEQACNEGREDEQKKILLAWTLKLMQYNFRSFSGQKYK